MKKVMKGIMGVIVLFLVMCSAKKDHKFIKVSNIVLDQSCFFFVMKKVSAGFVGYNAIGQDLVLYSSDGNLLDSYRRIGKAPGEYSHPIPGICIGVKDTIYVPDQHLNKIMVFSLANNKFKFVQEFRLDPEYGQIVQVEFYKNYLWVQTTGQHKILILDRNGNVKKKLIYVKKAAIGLYSFAIQNDIIAVLENGMFINFYKINGDFELTLIKKVRPNFTTSVKPHMKNKVLLSPLFRIFNFNSNFLIEFHPNLKMGKTFLEGYDMKGNYIGNYIISDVSTKEKMIWCKLFSNDGNTLFYQWMDINSGKMLSDSILVAQIKER